MAKHREAYLLELIAWNNSISGDDLADRGSTSGTRTHSGVDGFYIDLRDDGTDYTHNIVVFWRLMRQETMSADLRNTNQSVKDYIDAMSNQLRLTQPSLPD